MEVDPPCEKAFYLLYATKGPAALSFKAAGPFWLVSNRKSVGKMEER